MITYQELLKSGENELVSSNISDAELDAWYLLDYITYPYEKRTYTIAAYNGNSGIYGI